jgi:hypothetical protein
VVEVVRESDRHAACEGGIERCPQRYRERVRQADVVDRDLERSLRRPDEVGEQARDLLRRLPAVGERAKLYRAALARCSAL